MSDVSSRPDQLNEAIAMFRERFGREPRFAAAAPGRVNLIGEHTDYNDGFVFPMAIERQTLIVADRRADEKPTATVLSDGDIGEQREATFDVNTELTQGTPGWSSYMQGVVAGCIEKGMNPGGFDAVVVSTVPLGGGLSSSAALEVSTATLVETMTGKTLDGVEKALLCQKAEHEFAGMPCGIMDQFISAMAEEGHAMLLDCRDHSVRQVPLLDPTVAVLIANTNVKHALTGSEYPERRAQCEQAARALGIGSLRDANMPDLMKRKRDLEPMVFKRAYHVVSEIERTVKAADLLAEGDYEGFGRLMYDSHATLRDAFEVSCAELDLLVEIAADLTRQQQGVYGSRMTGGGFGGCTVSLVHSDHVKDVTRVLHTEYLKRTGVAPTIFATRPGAGARAVTV